VRLFSEEFFKTKIGEGVEIGVLHGGWLVFSEGSSVA
jgi:hypothetical protein